MSRMRSKPPETKRAWLSGLAITVTTLVGLFGFWHLSPGLTYIVACIALVGLIASIFLMPNDR